MNRLFFFIGALVGAFIIAASILLTPLARAQVVFPARGGTGTSSVPTYGQVLVGNENGTYSLMATSSLGISTTGGLATTSIDTEAELESILSNVSDVFTNNDGSLDDDNLSDNTTSDLTEGSNLYYTITRIRAALLASYDAIFGSATSTSATSTNLAVTGSFNFLGTIVTNVGSWFSGLFDSNFASKDTGDLTEGVNLYYTNARVQTFLDGISKGFFFSTTSVNYWESLQDRWATSSSNYWETQQTARTADDLSNNSIEDLQDVAAITENYGDLLFWNGSAWTGIATSSLGIASAIWGNITGTLSNQSDLQAALEDKQDSLTLPLPVSLGGTGNDNVADGDLFYGNSSLENLVSLAIGGDQDILAASNGVPVWVAGTTLCESITGGAGLCDGTDETGGGGLASSSPWSVGYLAYVLDNSTLRGVGTSSITINAPLTSSGTPGALVGGTDLTIDVDDIKAADLDLADVTLADFINDAGFLTGAITAIGPTAQAADGPTVTFATSTAIFNGLTPRLTITGSGDTLTFAPTLAGTLDNAGLSNSSVSYGGVTLSLGDSDSTPAFNLADATGLPIVAGTSGTLGVSRGGTGSTTAPSSWVLYGGGDGTFQARATTTLTISGPFNTSATPIVLGSSPITMAYWGFATTSQPSSSHILTSNGAAGVYGTATSTLTYSGPFVVSGTLGAQVGGTNSTITWTGLATTSQPASSNLLASNGAAGVFGVATSSVSSGAGISLSGTPGALVGGSALTITNSSPLSSLSASFPLSFSNPTLSWTGLSTSSALANTQIVYGTAANTIGSEAAFSYNALADRLTALYASTTGISTAYASSTSWFGGGLTDCDGSLTSKLLWDASTGWFSCGTDQTGAGGAPAGLAGQLQFNNHGAFGATSTLAFATSTLTLSVGTGSTTAALNVGQFAIFQSRFNADSEESASLTSTQSVDVQLGAGGYFNVYDTDGFSQFWIDGSDGTATFQDIVSVDADDASLLTLGEGGDASIGYDGTNLLINPRLVGSGHSIFAAGNLGVSTSSPYKLLSIGGDVVVGASSAGGTLGDLYLPKLGTAAGAFLAADPQGKVIATSTPAGSQGYTLSLLTGPSFSVVDGQTVYFGQMTRIPNTSEGRHEIRIPKTGTITKAFINIYSGTAGSGEDWSLYIRLNQTTDTLIETIGASANNRIFNNESLNISVTEGDTIEIKMVNPTWATNPATSNAGGYIFIE